jgi:proline iminopeptidase
MTYRLNKETKIIKSLSLSILCCFILGLTLTAQEQSSILGADSTEIYFDTFGTGDPVVLLSGGPGINPHYLMPLFKKVGETHQAILFHQRGVGKSHVSHVDSTSMSMDNYVNDIEALRLHLGVEQLTLIGHSWGGMMCMEYISRKPDHVANVILIGPGGPSPNFFTYFGDNIFMRLQPSDYEELALLDSLNKPNLSAIYPGYFYDRESALKAKSEIDFDKLFGQKNVNPVTIRNFAARTDSRLATLDKYQGRISLIQGRQDPVGESTVYEILEHLPNCEVHFIERCGHFPWLEKEMEFFELIKTSLN